MAEEMGHADDECLSVLSKVKYIDQLALICTCSCFSLQAQKFVLVSLARVLILVSRRLEIWL